MLVALGGLPGAGKSTLARALAAATGAVWLRIDTIEQALRASGELAGAVGGAGYQVAAALACDNLTLGRAVIADAVNPLPVTRAMWRDAALGTRATLVEIEVVCSDPAEHRARVEAREADIPGHVLPRWSAVLARGYAPWPGAFRLDTAGRDSADCLATLLALPELRALPRI
jgi:predicted kinase